MFRFPALLLLAFPLLADCRLPELVPNALDRMSPQQLIESGHFLRAIKVLDAKEPTNALLLSQAKAALGDLDEALKLAEIALKFDKSNAEHHVQTAAVAGRLAAKAGLLKQLTYAHRAKQELDEAIALDANNTRARWGLMMYYFAAPPLIGGDKAKARQLGEQLALDTPDLGRYYQGRLAIEMDDPAAAETFYKQSATENPLSFDTISALANFYIERKPDQSKAERWACAAVHAEPTRGEAWALLAKTYAMSGCWTEAIATADRSAMIDTDNLVPYYAVASIAIDRHQQSEMATAFMRKYMSQPTEGNQPAAEDAQRQRDRLR